MNKPESLYIHIPFCSSICDYCDFTKLQFFSFLADSYIESLIKEIEYYQINKKLKTIYIGGGTPSVLSLEQLETIFNVLDEYRNDVIEFTVEVNPESINEEKLKLFKKHGVNRISMGVESTNDKILHAIGRKHTFKDVKNAVNLIRKCGFDNLSLDLILGLPNVSISLLKKDLENIIELNPDNVSCYSLTVHENTKFYINGIKEPPSDFLRELYDLTNETLLENGYIHYEISSWGRKNKFGLHNFTYWTNKTYYGLGLGASGYINKTRYKNTKNLNKYLNHQFIDEQEEVTRSDDLTYEIMLNLRTINGLDLTYLKNKFNIDFLNDHKDKIDNFVSKKWLIFDQKNNKLIATYEGMMVLDQIILDLI